jgi:hypothetical protein
MIEQFCYDDTSIAVPETERAGGAHDSLKLRLRRMLAEQGRKGVPLTYKRIASKLPELGRDSKLMRRMLEELMEEDARAGRPFVSAVAIGSSGNGLPGPWFFLKAQMLGRFEGRHGDVEAFAFHAAELHHCSTYRLP